MWYRERWISNVLTIKNFKCLILKKEQGVIIFKIIFYISFEIFLFNDICYLKSKQITELVSLVWSNKRILQWISPTHFTDLLIVSIVLAMPRSLSRSLSSRIVNFTFPSFVTLAKSIFIDTINERNDRCERLPNTCIIRSATPCPSPSPISLHFTYPILRRPTTNYTIDFRRRYHVTSARTPMLAILWLHRLAGSDLKRNTCLPMVPINVENPSLRYK